MTFLISASHEVGLEALGTGVHLGYLFEKTFTYSIS
jgi:hypothetical protein